MTHLVDNAHALIKRVSTFGLFGFLFCLTSCDRPEPELPNLTNIESSLESMLSYLPYEANRSYTFVSDADNVQWTITPYTNSSLGVDFPDITSATFGSMWENLIFAEFVMDGIGKAYRSQITMDVYPNKGGFYVFVGADIRFDVNSYYYGSYTQTLDTVAFNNFWSADTITIPLKGLYFDKQPTVTLPENSVAYLVKNKGLAEFSIDGGRTYWRLAE